MEGPEKQKMAEIRKQKRSLCSLISERVAELSVQLERLLVEVEAGGSTGEERKKELSPGKRGKVVGIPVEGESKRNHAGCWLGQREAEKVGGHADGTAILRERVNLEAIEPPE